MAQVTLGLTGPFAHGRGFTEPAAVADPAVGVGFSITIGSSYWERLAALTFRVVSDNNAADRLVTLTVNGGDGVPLAIFPAASVQAATLTYNYSFLAGVSTFNAVAGTSVVSPGPGFFLQPAYTLVVTVGSVQAGDQISRIRFLRERFTTGPGGYQQGSVTDLELKDLVRARLAEFLT